jgi:hypothetical protein
MDPMTTHIDITDDQIEALRIEAGQAGDSLQIACCVIALADDRDRWARAVSEAKWAQADALWPSPAAARAECARVIADDQAQQAPTRYRVIEEGGAETTITAHSIAEAIEGARAWVGSGSYDAPGAVTAWVTELGPNGDGIHGTARPITVRVG